MLLNLFIKNYLLIETLEIELDSQLNVITGETGSGKSILLAAISFCLTGKSGVEIIRSGHENCLVSLTFSKNKDLEYLLTELGISLEDGEDIIITRQINKDGKKKCMVNNQPVSQKVIEIISEGLATIYGQHSFSNLFKASSHIKILDDFISDKEVFKNLSDNYKSLKSLLSKKEELINEQEKTAAEADYLSHAAAELKKAKIIDNEEQELAEQRTKLQQGEKQRQLIADLLESIKNSPVSNTLSSMTRQISRNNSAELFSEIYELLEKAQSNIDEAENLLEKLSNAENSSLNLDEIEERLFMIRALARKYNVFPNQLKNYLQEVENKISTFENSNAELQKIEKSLIEAKKLYVKNANDASNHRIEAAKLIEKLVANELTQLKMPGCHFKIVIENLSEEQGTEKGINIVKFTASTNPGTPYGSIEKIASGGEMARFMLALQVALFQNNNNLPTIIFDEIDTGIGGVVADSVGERLRNLSKATQVIAITHQPQVASKSTLHMKVSKESAGHFTTTQVKVLNMDEKIEEIARMLSGKITTEAGKKAARELIETPIMD